ncbi:hypothetical protein TNCV_3657991 [Trichonephila clavipes]|nr:hypothetical protein TNCV_3657991 [Trichonephila clavipes]
MHCRHEAKSDFNLCCLTILDLMKLHFSPFIITRVSENYEHTASSIAQDKKECFRSVSRDIRPKEIATRVKQHISFSWRQAFIHEWYEGGRPGAVYLGQTVDKKALLLIGFAMDILVFNGQPSRDTSESTDHLHEKCNSCTMVYQLIFRLRYRIISMLIGRGGLVA